MFYIGVLHSYKCSGAMSISSFHTTVPQSAFAPIKNVRFLSCEYIDFSSNGRALYTLCTPPAKVISTIGGGIPFFYILTEEGRVYNLEEWDSEATLIADLSKYKVIDMTPHINGNDRYVAMCFLTEDANIIDSQGKSYK